MTDSFAKRIAGRLRAAIMLLTLIAAVIAASAVPVLAAGSDEAKAEKLLASMSTDEKIAQMMVVAMPQNKAASIQEKYQFGGYILFARDFGRSSKKGLIREIAACQKASDIGMLIGVDEEGGAGSGLRVRYTAAAATRRLRRIRRRRTDSLNHLVSTAISVLSLMSHIRDRILYTTDLFPPVHARRASSYV